MGSRVFSVGVVVAMVGMCASPAWGAFPGRDGDLVVASGGGLELVAPATGAARAICSGMVLCGHPARPAFSPNGRAIAYLDTNTRRAVVVSANGSCLWCLLGTPLTTLTGSAPAFTPSGRGITVAGNGLWGLSLSGGGERRLLKGRMDGAVWSSRGLIALVRGRWIWVGRPGHGKLRRLAQGQSPSFSPDGARLALARGGYVWLARVGGGAERRLARGGAPAWSPSGRRIAYIAAGGAVKIVPVNGGQSRRVDSVRGTTLDWQPLPAAARHPCDAPTGSTVLESTRDAIVYSKDRSIYGCLNALGGPRLLLDASDCYCGPATAVRLAGRFAALQAEFGKAPEESESDTLYDLSNGKRTGLVSVPWQTPEGISSGDGLDALALDSSGFVAWRKTVRALLGIVAVSCPSESLCVAGDQAGNVLSSTNPTGGPAAWTSAAVLSNQSIYGVACPTTALCVAGDSAGDILTATDPTGGASAWTKTTVDPNASINALSCPSTSLCVAAGATASGGRDALLTSTNPTGGASSWSSSSIASGGTVTSLSCPSVSLCVATTNIGEVFTSANPTGGANAWTKTVVDPGASFTAVSCPSISLCVAGGSGPGSYSSGEVLTTTRPGGGAGAWTKTTIDPAMIYNPVSLDALFCASVALCVASDNFGRILTSSNPTGRATAWMKASFGPDPHPPLRTISCPSVSLCIAGDSQGNFVTSSDPAAGANSWTHATLSEQLYSHDDQGTRVVDTASPSRGNSIGNVSLHGDSLILSWTHDATQRQLELH